REVEANYFRKTQILPIMHVLALQRNLADKHPELPGKLFRLFSESKRWAQRWRRAIPSLVEAWPNHHLDEERKIFETDPWAYGLEANRHVLEKFLPIVMRKASVRETWPRKNCFIRVRCSSPNEAAQR